jgi:hypothetical protein
LPHFIYIVDTIIILTVAVIIGCSLVTAAPGNIDFSYDVDGQTVTLSPSLASAYDDYKWVIDRGQTHSETDWIQTTDIHDHHTVLSFNATYTVKLVARSGGSRYSVGHHIKIGSDHDSDTNTTSISPSDESGIRNILDSVPEPVKQFIGGLHPAVIPSLLLIIGVGGGYFLLRVKPRYKVFSKTQQ